MSPPNFEDSETASHPRKKVVFDPTVNLGHLLTFAGFIMAIFVTWSTLDKRVIILEEANKTQAVQDRAQDQRADQARSELKETLSKVERSLEKLNDKLDGNFVDHSKKLDRLTR